MAVPINPFYGTAFLKAATKEMLKDIDPDLKKDLRHYGQAFIRITPDGRAVRIDPSDIAAPSGDGREGGVK
jgi:hypothetical protein